MTGRIKYKDILYFKIGQTDRLAGWVGGSREETLSRDQEVIHPTPSYLTPFLGVIFDQVRF